MGKRNHNEMKKYKLTNQELRTYGGCQWEVGKQKTTSGEGELCESGWLHYYHSPELAVLLNPIHAAIEEPRLWEVSADGEHKDDCGLKGGCTEMTLLREIALPSVTTEQRVEFGIRCALEVYQDKAWRTWAEEWLSGEDRSEGAAEGAAGAGWAAAEAAAEAARTAAWAEWAAEEAEWAAEEAGWAAMRAAWAGLSPERLQEIAERV